MAIRGDFAAVMAGASSDPRAPVVTSLELPLRLGKDTDLLHRYRVDGGLRIPNGPGWGMTFEDLAALS